MTSSRIIRASLQSLMIGHTFLIILIPLLVALFYYSTPYSRRQPIFILNVISLILALVVGVIGDASNIHSVLSPQHVWSERFQITIGFMGNFQMMLVDTILLVRLITVYPLRRVGLARFVLLTFLPIVLKIARVVNTSIFIYQLDRIVNSSEGSRRAKTAWVVLPYEKVEWIAQVVDNSYASIAFLWTIGTSRVKATSAGLMSVKTSRQASPTKRIQTLFHLALSNFVIPTIISIVQLVMLFRIDNLGPANLNNIALVNTNISVIGVVFATVWAGKERRREVKAMLDLPPVEREQLHQPENLETITESYLTDHANSTSDKDITVANSQGADLVRMPDVTFTLPRVDQ